MPPDPSYSKLAAHSLGQRRLRLLAVGTFRFRRRRFPPPKKSQRHGHSRVVPLRRRLRQGSADKVLEGAEHWEPDSVFLPTSSNRANAPRTPLRTGGETAAVPCRPTLQCRTPKLMLDDRRRI